MMKLSGTRTETNLKAAFAGESQARNKYFYFAAKAKEEGHDALARYFEETAVNEQEHAKIWLKFLDGIGSSADNLQTAIDGEHHENLEMYPSFAKTAREEGFEPVAWLFDQVADIEKNHEKDFRRFLEKLASPTTTAAATVVLPDKWKCDNCGNVITEKSAPTSCGVCGNVDVAWSGYKAFKQVTY